MMTRKLQLHTALAAIVLAGAPDARADESSQDPAAPATRATQAADSGSERPPVESPALHPGDPEAGEPGAIDDVLQRLQQLEEDNQKLRDEVDELRAQSGDGWLTEQRAEQIKALVADVLADADTRASLLQGGLTAGWSDGFFLADPNGRFSLKIGGQLQVRWVFNFQDTFNDQYRTGFELPHTRLWFGGHLFRPELDLEYFVRGRFQREGGGSGGLSNDVGGAFLLQDAWVRVPFSHNWSVRAGQYKVPFNREELVESQYQLAAERSNVNESLNLGRSQGVELQYQNRSWRWNLMVSDGGDDSLGGFGNIGGTSPMNTPAISVADVEVALTTRLEYLLAGTWKQFADFTSPPGEEFGVLVGAGVHWQLNEQGSPPFDGDQNWLAWTADASVEWGGANLFFQYIQHYVDTFNFGVFNLYGIVVQGGIYITPKWEAFARYEWGGANMNAQPPVPQLQLVTFGVNYYLDGHDAKWTTDIGVGLSEISNFWDSDITGTRTDGSGTSEGQVILRTQFQILF
jgi:hypothetical protein